MNLKMICFFQVFFYFFQFGSGSALAYASEAKPNPFQKTIQRCLTDKVSVMKIQNLEDLYRAVDTAFPLVTSETVEREILFAEKGEVRKLKLQHGKISIFRVLPDKTVELLNNDARQKGLTEEAAINQIVLRADIQSDWLNVKETRSGLATLVYGRQQGQIKSLVFEIMKSKVKLECSKIELSDICSCRI